MKPFSEGVLAVVLCQNFGISCFTALYRGDSQLSARKTLFYRQARINSRNLINISTASQARQAKIAKFCNSSFANSFERLHRWLSGNARCPLSG